MGNGGGIITKKLLFTVLLIASLSLSGIASASAADVGTVQTQTKDNSTVQEKVNTQSQSLNNIDTQTKTQNTVNNNVKSTETKVTTSKTSTNATNTSINETTKANKTSTQTNPVTTKSTIDQSNTKDQTTSQTTTQTSSTQKSMAAEGENKTLNQTTSVTTSFTLSEIKDAATRVKAFIETNKALPNYVKIGTTEIKMPEFLKLLTAGLLQLNSGKTTPIPFKTVGAPAQPSETITSGNIDQTGYLDLAKRVNTFIDTNGVIPNYATSSLGKLRYESLIYMYSKIFDFQSANNRLPSYVSVKAWNTVSSVVLAQARPVYITSDNINGVTIDTNRINAIVKALKDLGLTAVNAGLGPNTHISVLSSAPVNALIVDIYGGACAGTIYEMGTSYYKKLVGTKKVFSVWLPPATDITGLAWLPRSHDDNFSPSSFTGLANPDQYLLKNGYEYIYSGNLDAIISSIYKEATTA